MIRKTRRGGRSLAALLASLLSLVALSPAVAQAPAVVKLATLVPEGSVWDKALRDMGAEWTSSTQGRVSLRINEKIRWNAGYQYYGYHEDFSGLQNYRAHTGYTSVLWAF